MFINKLRYSNILTIMKNIFRSFVRCIILMYCLYLLSLGTCTMTWRMQLEHDNDLAVYQLRLTIIYCSRPGIQRSLNAREILFIGIFKYSLSSRVSVAMLNTNINSNTFNRLTNLFANEYCTWK